MRLCPCSRAFICAHTQAARCRTRLAHALTRLSLQVDVFLNGRRTHLQMRIHHDGRLVFPQWNNATVPQVPSLARALLRARARSLFPSRSPRTQTTPVLPDTLACLQANALSELAMKEGKNAIDFRLPGEDPVVVASTMLFLWSRVDKVRATKTVRAHAPHTL